MSYISYIITPTGWLQKKRVIMLDNRNVFWKPAL